jgi:hypothetical protein
MTDPLYTWAEEAARLRFGPHVVLREDESRKAIFLERPGEAPRALGSGKTWPDAMIDAVKHSADIPQPPPLPRSQPAPEGEEFIEEFCGAMRQRDLLTEFLIWYGERSDKDPEGYPRALHRGEWFEALAAFIGGVE